jgi:Tol biopolymer transport system component/DNA-binding winged helix-turn-helix (wHTH) protein
MSHDADFLTPLADGFRIGEWTVLPRSLEITRPGETVHVEPKPMQVLTLLAAHASEPVTRDELLETVWSEVYVTENALSRCISQLRKLFDDDPRAPRVIETIPTVGYRLIAPVYHLGDGVPVVSEAKDLALSVTASVSAMEPEEIAEAPVSTVDSAFRGRMGLAWGFVALAFGALVAISMWGGDVPAVEPVTRPLTSAPGRETGPALSPDGSRVLYVHAPPDARGRLVVQVLGEGPPLPLTDGAARDASPAWSPDGRTVAFVRCEAEGCGLFSVPALGGEARRLSDAPAFPWGLAFAPDGKALAFVTRDTASAPIRLALLDLATGAHRPLTDPPTTSGGDLDPVFSPDGSTLVFRRRTGGGGEDLYRLVLPGGVPERLTHDDRGLAGVAFSRDGRDVLFSSSRTGMYELWRMPATGGTPERVRGLVARDPGQPEPGDGRLVFEEWAFEINLWSADADSAAARPLVTSTWWDKHPHLRADGERIAFISNRSGPPEVWLADGDGANPTRLTDFGGASVEAPRWAPDGARLAFQARPDERAEIFVIAADGGPPRLLSMSEADDVAPRWSRNGRRLYFGSNRDGAWQLWAMPAEGGEAVRVTDAGGYTGEESADGMDVLYTKYGLAGLWARPVAGGPERLVTDGLAPISGTSWAVTEAGVLFPQRIDGVLHTVRLDPATGATDTIAFALGQLMAGEPGLTASTDGRRVVFAQVDRVESDLMLVEPFE